MCKVIIFAGTTEGRSIAEYLERHQVKIHVCTATEYGESLIKRSDYIGVTAKRLNREEMEQLIYKTEALVVVDATHPYATAVSNHIKEACENTKVTYIRLLREETDLSNMENTSVIYVNSVKDACEYLKRTDGNVFVTTGSKELKEYTNIEDYKERIYARVLSGREAILAVMDLGFEGKNLICMQGPFSEELNYAMLKQTKANFLVTKEAGKNGGFLEKINAASRLNITTIVIGRPKEEDGYSYSKVIELLKKKLSFHTEKRQISVIGIGMGMLKGMTGDAIQAIQAADIVFGASRMLKGIEALNKKTVQIYKKEAIGEYLLAHREYERIAVLVSGDVGFYSAANGFLQYFKDEQVNYICGISSLSYLCAKLGKAWDHVCILSNHGVQVNTIDAVRRNTKVFTLMGGKDSVVLLMQELISFGFLKLNVWVGENLGYEKERIVFGSPKELLEKEFEVLCVVYIENPFAKEDSDRIGDEEFIRGSVPMTKEEVRTVSISKLELKKDSIVYDIGAGTGSVSIQAAKKAYEGYVYAIERKSEAVFIIEENKRKFQVSNIKVIEGSAPEVLKDLPVPTHAFIGGSNGNLSDIIKLLLSKNPKLNIVISAITIETIAEAVSVLKKLNITNYEIIQLQTAKGKAVGAYHMMMGQNPVIILSIRGGESI
jgi:precorrin-6Y C5,15-methyltransferase (decarboxylating)